MLIAKLVITKTNSKYMIGIKFYNVIKRIVLRSEYVETFQVKQGDKDKSNKLMSFRIDDEKLLEKYEVIWTKIEDLKNIELNASPAYDTDKKNQNDTI